MCNRSYARWVHRKPAKVLLPYENTKVDLKKEKIIDLDPSTMKNNQTEGFPKSSVINSELKEPSPKFSKEKCKEITEQRQDKIKRREFYLNQQKVFNENNEIMYEKLKGNDGRVSTLLVKSKSKKDRARSGLSLVEGWRLIADGLQADCKLKYIIFSRLDDLYKIRPFLPTVGVKIYKIPYKDIEMWSDVETSPGIFGIFETPTPGNIKKKSNTIPLNFICDNIRVPGNLGAILRAAMGVGCEKVLLTKGCVDLWDPKVIRSAAGAHFRVPIYPSIEWNEMPEHTRPESAIFIADSNPKNTVEDSHDSLASTIPVLPYYGVDYSTFSHSTLIIIIGGETEGISEDSYKFASSRNGLRLNIPLIEGVDSLNTGMATAVIACEIKKQFVQAWSKMKNEKVEAELNT